MTRRARHGDVGAVLSGLLAAALFGASTPAAKSLLRDVVPLMLAGLLYLGAAAAALPFALHAGPRVTRSGGARLAAAVLVGGAVAPVLLLLALSRAPAASVALWLNLETVATVLLAWALFREHVEPRTWLAVALVVGGGLALVVPHGAAHAAAAALAGGACVCWALDNNLAATLGGFTPAEYVLVKGAVAGAVNVVLALGGGASVPDRATALRALAIGAMGYGVSIMLYVRSAQRLGAARAQLIFAAAPFLGVAAAALVLREPIQAMQLAAAAAMGVGVVVMLSARHAHEHRHAEITHAHSHRHDDGHHDHSHPGYPASLRHTHTHRHSATTHAHRHVPDLHHRHEH